MCDLYERILAIGNTHGFKNMTVLCKESGVPRSTMSELKMGRTTTISVETAIKLASALDVSVEYLLGKEQKESPPPVEGRLSGKQKALIAAVAELPDDMVSFLLVAAKDWLKNHKSADSSE